MLHSTVGEISSFYSFCSFVKAPLLFLSLSPKSWLVDRQVARYISASVRSVCLSWIIYVARATAVRALTPLVC